MPTAIRDGSTASREVRAYFDVVVAQQFHDGGRLFAEAFAGHGEVVPFREARRGGRFPDAYHRRGAAG
ncbi:hypothetical protein GCM10022243_42470 [Saccharothrix violaceirubra]